MPLMPRRSRRPKQQPANVQVPTALVPPLHQHRHLQLVASPQELVVLLILNLLSHVLGCRSLGMIWLAAKVIQCLCNMSITYTIFCKHKHGMRRLRVQQKQLGVKKKLVSRSHVCWPVSCWDAAASLVVFNKAYLMSRLQRWQSWCSMPTKRLRMPAHATL